MPLTDADRIANSVGPDQTAPRDPDQTAPRDPAQTAPRDPDQTTPRGSTLFAQTYLSKNLGK